MAGVLAGDLAGVAAAGLAGEAAPPVAGAEGERVDLAGEGAAAPEAKRWWIVKKIIKLIRKPYSSYQLLLVSVQPLRPE